MARRTMTQQQRFDLYDWLKKPGRNIDTRSAADLASEASKVLQFDVSPSSIKRTCTDGGLKQPQTRSTGKREGDALGVGSVVGLTELAKQVRNLANELGARSVDMIALDLVIWRKWPDLREHTIARDEKQRGESSSQNGRQSADRTLL